MRTPFVSRHGAPHALLLGAAALLCLASPAHAQLGRLKKMGADAVKDAAKEKLGVEKKDAPGSAASARSTDGIVTGERVTLVLASLEPQVAQAQRTEEAQRARAAFKAKRDAYDKCAELATKNFRPGTPAHVAAVQRNEARITALQNQAAAASDRMAKAAEAGDMRKYAIIADTVNVLQSRASMLSIGATCSPDFTPPVLIGQQSSGDDSDGASGEFDPGPAVTRSMSRYDYGLLRERLALWVLLQENPSLAKGRQGVFTADEEAVLTANAAALKKFAPYFRTDAMIWKTWSDVKSW